MKLTSAELRLRAMGTATTLLLVVALAACSRGGGASDPTTSARSTVSASTIATTSTTEPPSSDGAVVRMRVVSLLRDWDAAMTALREKPTEVIGHPYDERRRALAELFTSDSPYVADIDKLLRAYSSGGVAARPSTGGISQHTLYLRTSQAPTADSVSFVWCSFDDSVSYRISTGKVVDDRDGVSQGGGEAHRVDGQWRLYRLFQLSQKALPHGSANPCMKFAAASAGNS